MRSVPSPGESGPASEFSLGSLLSRKRIIAVAAAAAIGFANKSCDAKATNIGPLQQSIAAEVQVVTSAPTPLPTLVDPEDLPSVIIPYSDAVAGYVTGSMVDGATFVYSGVPQQKDYFQHYWEYGRILHKEDSGDDECGWARSSAVSNATATGKITFKVKPGICVSQMDYLADRDNIGQNFNCLEHVCDDGTFFTRIDPSFFSQTQQFALNYDQRHGNSYDFLPAGGQQIGGFHYRNQSPDGKKAWGRDVLQYFLTTGDNVTLNFWGELPFNYVANSNLKGGPLNPAYDSAVSSSV